MPLTQTDVQSDACVWPDVVQSSGCKPAATISAQKRRASQCLDSLDAINRKLPWKLPGDAAGPAFTAEDMQLLHQFSTKTYATFDTAPSQYPIWQHTAIRIGFQHRFLLRGLLAVSALHLAITEDQTWLLASSSVNFNFALTEIRQVMDLGVDDANAPAMFLFSAAVVVHALAVGSVQQAIDPLADMVQCIRTIRGVMSIVQPFYHVLIASEVEPLVLNGIRKGFDAPAEDILALKELVAEWGGGWAPGEDTVYGEAIDHLYAVAREARGCTPGISVLGIVFSWPHLLPEPFLSFLDDRSPIAVIIFLHFTALMDSSADFWCLD
ncbi:putative C6 zinc finger domain-containing protein [Botryosphaeria dothidea]|uniref:C6 zinc finger domain-containing protein n=1 Tax=Botryosphaeria dothidea TaxID=55169 RepID=A0A8H4IXW1_9PEZI|nr:putative C6 zinc finger domain-containing protein [Botryosphaeria dothidea]